MNKCLGFIIKNTDKIYVSNIMKEEKEKIELLKICNCS